jgi:hypothetical protein
MHISDRYCSARIDWTHPYLGVISERYKIVAVIFLRRKWSATIPTASSYGPKSGQSRCPRIGESIESLS